MDDQVTPQQTDIPMETKINNRYPKVTSYFEAQGKQYITPLAKEILDLKEALVKAALIIQEFPPSILPTSEIQAIEEWRKAYIE